MKSYLVTIFLSLLLVTSPVIAQEIVLETQVSLGSGQTWRGTFQVKKGILSVNVSTTQGVLNFTLVQNHEKLISFELEALQQTEHVEVEVENGIINATARSTDHFLIRAQISVLILQQDNEVSEDEISSEEILIAGLVTSILLLPVIYVIGYSRGKKSI